MPKPSLTIRINQSVLSQLKAVAAEEGMSQGLIIERALLEKFGLAKQAKETRSALERWQEKVETKLDLLQYSNEVIQLSVQTSAATQQPANSKGFGGKRSRGQ